MNGGGPSVKAEECRGNHIRADQRDRSLVLPVYRLSKDWMELWNDSFWL